MTLTEARKALAAALSAVDGYKVQPRPFRAAPKAGDGWVAVTRLAPADYSRSSAGLTAVLVFGQDQAAAEERLEQDATALINAVTGADDLYAADVALEIADILTTSSAATPLYGALLTLTLEVD